MENKFILDACCGGKMCWFNKNNPNALYLDERTFEKGSMQSHPNFEVNPDVVGDYRDMTFKDKSFKLVMWDPPHIVRLGNKSWMSQKYGMLGLEWEKDLTKGFNECWRVLEDYGVLVFKWSEPEISLKKVLSLFHTEPLFGHTSGRSGKTKWCCFMKIPKSSQNINSKEKDFPTYKLSETWKYGPEFEERINQGFEWVVEITGMRGGKNYKFCYTKELAEKYISSHNLKTTEDKR